MVKYFGLILILLLLSCVKPVKLVEVEDVDNVVWKNIVSKILINPHNINCESNRVTVLNVTQNGLQYIFKTSLLNKDDFVYFLNHHESKPQGFFQNDSDLVIIYGELVEKFFLLTNHKKSFKFLATKKNAIIKAHGTEIEPPPVVFEPIVWKFIYQDNKFSFIDKALFNLLE